MCVPHYLTNTPQGETCFPYNLQHSAGTGCLYSLVGYAHFLSDLGLSQSLCILDHNKMFLCRKGDLVLATV